MKNFYFLLLFILISKFCSAQNLLLNGSFENYTPPCPSTSPNWGILQVDNWRPGNYIAAMNSYPSVDLYCGEANYSNCFPGPVPNVGSDGVAYVGMHTRIYSTPYNEDIYQLLQTPLVPGSSYRVSFDLMTCQSGLFIEGPSDFCVYTNIDTIVPACPSDSPSIINVGCVPFDSISNVSWSHHSIVFNAPLNSNVIIFSGGACHVTQVYYYLDNVVLVRNSQTAIGEEDKNAPVGLYPNPFHDALHIQSALHNESEIIFYDVLSRTILRKKFTGQIDIDTHILSDGFYFYQLRNDAEILQKGKIVKE
jgi:hypothetical protein